MNLSETLVGARDEARMPMSALGDHILRWMPSILATLLLATTARGAARELDNSDTYFHLRFGAEFAQGSWSLTDPGTVSSFATESWVPTQWLSQVAMFQVEELFGLPGVAWLTGVMMVAYALALLTTTRQLSSMLVAGPVSALAIAASFLSLSARPQVISLILITLATWAWLRTAQDFRPRWWLVPLTWIWAQVHGMWIVAVIIGLVAVVGLLLDSRSPRTARLFLIPLGSVAAAMMTPVGPRLVTSIAAVGDRTAGITEWGPPDLATPFGLLALLPVGVLVLVMARGPRPSWTHLALTALAVGWTLHSVRSVAVGAAMVAPILAASLAAASPRLRRDGARRSLAGLAGAAAVVLGGLALVVPNTSAEVSMMDPEVEAALDDLPTGTSVVNDWGRGGYVMWRFPHLDPLMHGYADTFTVSELERNRDLLELEPGWDDLIASTGIEWASLPADSKLAYALRGDGWTVEAQGDRDLLLRAPPE